MLSSSITSGRPKSNVPTSSTALKSTDARFAVQRNSHATFQVRLYTDANGILNMGSDVEDFYAMAQLRVYKPTPDALERIVNFIAPVREQKARKDAQQLLAHFLIGSISATSVIRLRFQRKPSRHQCRSPFSQWIFWAGARPSSE